MSSNDNISGDGGRNTSGEQLWIEKLRQGDDRGFEALYRFYFPRLSQFVYRYVHSTYIAEDLVHNIFFSLWRNREEIKPVETLRPYLYRAARNQAIKHIDRSKGDMIADYPLNAIPRKPPSNIGEDTDQSKLKAAVIDAVGKLPDKRRQIYLLHREDGLTYKEISEVLDISIKTVETQMSRSLSFLRTYLSDFLSVTGMILPFMKEWL